MIVCHDFFKEGFTIEILLEAQVIQIGEVVAKIRQQITEL